MMKKDTMTRGTKQEPSAMGMGMQKDGMAHDAMKGPTGMFAGQNRHAVTGGYTIERMNDKTSLTLTSDFSVDAASDAYLVLSPTTRGDAPGAVTVAMLHAAKGAQTYSLPAGTDLAALTHLLVYNRKSNQTLGQADMAGAGMMKSDAMMKPAAGMMSHDTGMRH